MDIFVFGLTLSLMYALIAVGFALIMGTSRIFDLSFGAYYLTGAYSFLVLYPVLGKGPALLLSLIISVILAFLIHRFVLYPFRANPLAVLVASCALAMAIAQGIILRFGTEYKYLPPLIEGTTEVFGATIANQRFLAAVVSLVVLALLWFFLNRTKQGLAIRALVQEPEAAQLMGVKPRMCQLIVACIGAALAALAAIMVVSVFSLSPFIWLDALLLAFAGIVLGGLGSIWGALLAMFVIGFAETLVTFLIPGGAFFRQAVYLVIMVIVLVVRPWGFFGKKEEV